MASIDAASPSQLSVTIIKRVVGMPPLGGSLLGCWYELVFWLCALVVCFVCILPLAFLVRVPADPRTRTPVLTAPVHIACHASFGAAYRRRGGTGDPRAAGRSPAIPHVRGMGQLGYVRCPVQVLIGSPKHAHSHAEQGQKRLSACQCAWWGIVRAAC